MKKILVILGVIFLVMIASTYAIIVTYKERSAPADAKGQYLSGQGRTIRYVQAGSGPNLLLIHGCPGSLEDFDPVFDDLTRKFRVTAFDRPGHGYSASDDNLHTLNYNARVAEDVIEKLNLKNVVVVGHSYGAGTALSMAISNSPNIRALVLISAPGYKPVDVDAISYVLGIPYVGKALSVLLSPRIGPEMIRKRLTLGFKPNEFALAPSDMDLRIKMWTQPKVPVTRARELLNLEKDLVANSRHYSNILKRVLIIQGKEDWVTKAAWKLNEDILGSKLVVLDGVGHYPQFAMPSEVVRLIENFLQDSPEDSPGTKKSPKL